MGKGVPRLADNPVFVAELSSQVFPSSGVLGRFVIQIVDDIARGTGNDERVHRMVTMVYALLVEPPLQFQRHGSLKHALAVFVFPMAKLLAFGQRVHSLES